MSIKSSLFWATLLLSLSSATVLPWKDACSSTQNWDLLIVTCDTRDQIAALCSLMQTNPSPHSQENCSWNTATLYSPAGWGDSQ